MTVWRPVRMHNSLRVLGSFRSCLPVATQVGAGLQIEIAVVHSDSSQTQEAALPRVSALVAEHAPILTKYLENNIQDCAVRLQGEQV